MNNFRNIKDIIRRIIGKIPFLPAWFQKDRDNITFTTIFARFQDILELNNQILDLMATISNKLSGEYIFDRNYIESSSHLMADLVAKLISNFNILTRGKYRQLNDVFRRINRDIEKELSGKLVIPETDYVIPYSSLTRDYNEVTGSKNSNVAELKNQLGLVVPHGFAITTRAFKTFFEYNGLNDKVNIILHAWRGGDKATEEASREIKELIDKAKLPPDIQKAFDWGLDNLKKRSGKKRLRLAVRSSALGEDSEHSFAGQYESFLNIRPEELPEYYKAVLASTYSVSAMEYRLQKNFSEQEIAMSVACQMMIKARASGVIYTLDPVNPERKVILITGTWGLGAPLVSGKVYGDSFVVSRNPGHNILELDIVRKKEALVPSEKGGCELQEVKRDLQTRATLSSDQVQFLVNTALSIERYFKKPQDIEWTLDYDNQFYILQARQLNISAKVSSFVGDISSIVSKYPVIFSKKGSIVQKGIALGKVFMVNNEDDLERFPDEGAILVTHQFSPILARVVKKAHGIITDIGSPTGHMASIAREFSVPSIVNTEIATKVLTNGEDITVDAEANVIYKGRIEELSLYEFMHDNVGEYYEYRLLRRILKRITPLNLIDPKAKNFNPQGCKTFHDITRFIHEKAVKALRDVNFYNQRNSNIPARELKSTIPLDLIMIDIGGGFKEGVGKKTVTEDDIACLPMLEFLRGVDAPGAWNNEPMSVDFGSFMSSMTRTFSTGASSPKAIGQNLAVMSDKYVNISLRLGYHFSMIVAYISEEVNSNYAYFRFNGGVTDPVRRGRRAKFIGRMLEKNGFYVEVRKDLMVARIKKISRDSLREKLYLIGKLVSFTRQLDVKMVDDEQIDLFIKEFEELESKHSREQD